MREYNIVTPYGKIRTHESGSGTPIIFFHGWSVNAFSCKRLLSVLSKSNRVIIPTLPGSLPSLDWKGRASREKIQDALTVWFDRLNVSSSAMLIGHSLGGALASLLASSRSSKLKRLVLVDAVGVPITRSPADWRKAWLNKRKATYSRYGISTVVKYIDAQFAKNALLRTRDLIALSKLARTIDIRDIAKTIAVPTLFVWGDEDIFIPKTVAEELYPHFKNAEIIEVPGNHDWPLFEPELLIPILRKPIPSKRTSRAV